MFEKYIFKYQNIFEEMCDNKNDFFQQWVEMLNFSLKKIDIWSQSNGCFKSGAIWVLDIYIDSFLFDKHDAWSGLLQSWHKFAQYR